MDYAHRVTHEPSIRPLARMLRSVWRQAHQNPICPPTRLDDRVALVTGGSLGIGLYTSLGLAARGADVVSAARHREAGERMVATVRAELDRTAHFVPLDLADLRTLPNTLDRLQVLLRGRRLGIVVANAGYWPTRHALSAQGHEIAFAVNVLGHHELVRAARARGLLAQGCRVVVVTGDVYVTARRCTADFTYRGAWGGARAYARSKLGSLWYARELARRDPSLSVLAVHPGVVASGLAGRRPGLVNAVRRAILLAPEQGAQSPLFCATQPGLVSGSYYHNVLGRMELRLDDPASDDASAAALWELLDQLDGSKSRSSHPPAFAP